MSRAARSPSPFWAIKPGDTVVRMLAATIPMCLRVTAIEDRLIRCAGPNGWTFDRETGIEIDEELGWGPASGVSGSYLLAPRESDAIADANVIELVPADPPPTVRFRTATGSVYEVDNVALSWRRTPTLASGVLRSNAGVLLHPVRPEVGDSVVLVGPPYVAGLGPRIVITTAVVVVEDAGEADAGSA